MKVVKPGDRVRYVGDPMPPDLAGGAWLSKGECGCVVDVDDHHGVLVITWDRFGTVDMATPEDIVLVGDS